MIVHHVLPYSPSVHLEVIIVQHVLSYSPSVHLEVTLNTLIDQIQIGEISTLFHVTSTCSINKVLDSQLYSFTILVNALMLNTSP